MNVLLTRTLAYIGFAIAYIFIALYTIAAFLFPIWLIKLLIEAIF